MIMNKEHQNRRTRHGNRNRAGYGNESLLQRKEL